MTISHRTVAFFLAVAPLLPVEAAAQEIRAVPENFLHQVIGGVDRFAEDGGTPPVMRAIRVDPETAEESLVGFVFHTADIPPERIGYSAPIWAVAGLGLDGRLTGMRITDYWKSMRSSRGDFLGNRDFQQQFTGKHIAEGFRIFVDIESISRASVSVRAVARGVRDAARRVADAYMTRIADATAVIDDLDALSWLELRQAGIVKVMIMESEFGPAEMSLVHLFDDAFAARMLGAVDEHQAAAVWRQPIDALGRAGLAHVHRAVFGHL